MGELDHLGDEVEVLIVHGHSTDNTVEIARKYGCRVIFEDRGTISYARDIGVRDARGEFIAFTDADCVVDRGWLRNLIKHFGDDEVVSVGGPNITPEDDTEFVRCAGDVLSFLSKPGARYGLNVDEVIEIFHNPTCNVMYRRWVLEAVGGFNHDLVTCDDEELDYRIGRLGHRILYTPDAIVYHYRRSTWKKFMQQAYNYGIGRMQAIRLHRGMGRLFHFVPSLTILVIVALFALSFLDFSYFWGALSILVTGAFDRSVSWIEDEDA
jgi:GT2 family glycosyltransferase